MTPQVSIVMSVFNGGRYLRQSVDSILNQTFADFEFIVINDGSTDATDEILSSYIDKRMVLVHQENSGLTKALNRGIALARGKYVARQDADDISKPERLEKQVAFMEANPAVGLLSTRFEFINEAGDVTAPCWVTLDNKLLQQRLIEINQFCHGAAVIRKEAIDAVGAFREYFKYAQDHDLWLRIAEKYEIANLPDFLFQYRELDTAISSMKILVQSRYAEVAIEMALERRRIGSDAIQQGGEPALPSAYQMTKSLQRKLTDFYARRPLDMLNGLEKNGEVGEELTFLFKNLCAEKLEAETGLRDKCSELNSATQSVEKLKENLRASEVSHSKELQRKDEQISSLNERLHHQDQQLSSYVDQIRHKDDHISLLNERLHHQHQRLSSYADQIGQKDDQISLLTERLYHQDQEIGLLNERMHAAVYQIDLLHDHIQSSERHLRFNEEQIEQKDRQYLSLKAHLKGNELLLQEGGVRLSEVELRVQKLVEQLEDSNRKLVELQTVSNTEKQTYEKRITDLLNSWSWKITAPLRAIYRVVTRRP